MHVLLFGLFFILFASRTLGFDLSLAPGLSVKNAFLYVMFLILLIEAAVTRMRRLELVPVLAPFAVYTAYAIFSWLVVVLVLDYPGYSLRESLFALKAGPVEGLLVFLIFFYGITDGRRALWVIQSIVWLVIVGNVVTVIDALNIPDLGIIEEREDGRVGGTIGNSNEYAAFLALFLPAIVAMCWTERGLVKWLAGLGALLSGLAFLLALSRGAIVGLAVGAILGAYFLRSIIPPQVFFRATFGILLLSSLVVAGAFAFGYGDLVIGRFGEFGGGRFDASSGRNVIWGMALRDIADHPVAFLTGLGWFAYETLSPSGFAPHNQYLFIFYNLGLIGLGLFVLIVGNLLVTARRGAVHAEPHVRPWLIAFILGFIALMVTLFFGELYSSWIYVWAYVGISLRLTITGMRVEQTPKAGDTLDGISSRKIRATPTTGYMHGKSMRKTIV